MEISPDPARDMGLLEHIERDPNVTQASLAAQLGVAVGTVNWYLKRLIAKGYVKVKRAERRKLKYIITPEGIAFRARLTVDYIEQSLVLYRRTRQHVRDLLYEVRSLGYDRVKIFGEGDIADICRLSCLEQGIQIQGGGAQAAKNLTDGLPVLVVNELKVSLDLSEVEGGSGT